MVMAQSCHNQYDHPLLWCEQKRRAEERRIAEESLAIAQQRKEQAQVDRLYQRNEVKLTPLARSRRMLAFQYAK